MFEFLKSKAKLYDHRIKGSPIYELNTFHRAKLPEEVAKTVDTALRIADKSNGAFDPTILPLTRLWNFDNNPTLPDPSDIMAAKVSVNYREVTISEDNIVRIPEKYGLDLGGIAKGALVDSLADYLENRGYDNFLIEAGGDILVSGLKPDNRQWVIGIVHPRDKKEQAGEISLGKNEGRIAIVTSGDYEQFFIQDGIRYHHIINPVTGYPENDVISVTVVAPTCTKADALSTAAFVMGRKHGLEILENGKDTEGLIIFEESGKLETVMTTGFSNRFHNRLSD